MSTRCSGPNETVHSFGSCNSSPNTRVAWRCDYKFMELSSISFFAIEIKGVTRLTLSTTATKSAQRLPIHPGRKPSFSHTTSFTGANTLRRP